VGLGQWDPQQGGYFLNVDDGSGLLELARQAGVLGPKAAPELAGPPLRSGSPLRCGAANTAGLALFFKFNCLTECSYFSALDSNLGWGRCLTHVGTEG